MSPLRTMSSVQSGVLAIKVLLTRSITSMMQDSPFKALIRRRVEAYEALAAMESPDYNKLYEADRALHGTWFAAMDKMYLWSTLQNAHADYSRFRMLDTMTTGGLAEVIADHRNLMNAIERCDLAAFEPLVERHLYGGIRRLGSKLTEEYADYFEPEK